MRLRGFAARRGWWLTTGRWTKVGAARTAGWGAIPWAIARTKRRTTGLGKLEQRLVLIAREGGIG